MDAFGNRELLYRDPQISCLDPIPLVPRTRPPVIPHGTFVGRPTEAEEPPLPTAEDGEPAQAVVGVINVRDSFFAIPQDVQISRLRVVQELPKTTRGRKPELGYGMDKGGRSVLGTVPVERDGSVYFSMPAGVPIYFQLLDQDGLAVQTMRSTLYASAGETLFCMGCHDPRERAPSVGRQYDGLAFRRRPSMIEPEFEEARPLTFPRLVQPILDKQAQGQVVEPPFE